MIFERYNLMISRKMQMSVLSRAQHVLHLSDRYLLFYTTKTAFCAFMNYEHATPPTTTKCAFLAYSFTQRCRDSRHSRKKSLSFTKLLVYKSKLLDYTICTIHTRYTNTGKAIYNALFIVVAHIRRSGIS
jgi:hypothetical protein